MLGAVLVRGSGFRPAPTHQLDSEASHPLSPGLIHSNKLLSHPPAYTGGALRDSPRPHGQRGGGLAGARPAQGDASWAGHLLLTLVVGILVF